MKHIWSHLIFIFFFQTISYSQSIKGKFSFAPMSEIILNGYEGFSSIEIARTKTDNSGNFSLSYNSKYTGIATISIQNISGIAVILHNKENFFISWNNVQDLKDIQFTNSVENTDFMNGYILCEDIWKKQAGLESILHLFNENSEQYKWLQKESKLQNQEFTSYLDQLPKDSFAKYFLKLRKLAIDMPLSANRNKPKMIEHQNDFLKLNFNDDRLWNSGLLSSLFDYYKYLEIYPDETKRNEISNVATNTWVVSLSSNFVKQQEVADYCFKLLESIGSFSSAEYLANRILDQENCKIDDNIANAFNQYRVMSIGKNAPDIQLGENEKLSSINSKYKLIIFGASWCPNCIQDFPKLVENYQFIKKNYDVEIIYISIDTDENKFEEYYRTAPFITYSDYQGWKTKSAKDYHVFATPTYFLLDKKLKILAKLKAPEDILVWLNRNKL